ncbi:pyrroline-5-carboxylate reductase [Aerococcaceae bacterium DSM 111021]|nr:pyrroline-5-carboxylate reductase [Aerococcaceae bacterium DSM 111021]
MPTIGMIGVGNMGSAIAKAILRAGHEMILHNRTKEKLTTLAKQIGADVVGAESLSELINESDLIYIGVKPNQFQNIFDQLDNLITDSEPKTWVSMAAGLSIEQLEAFTPESHKWIRTMPNTPVEVGEGYIAYCTSENIETEKINLFEESLKNAGIVEAIPESLFNAVTGLAGSSPAFIYQLIEAMSDVGVENGLSREQSRKMASQAVKGASSMVIESGGHPSELKDRVTSPGGTTIAGIVALEHAGFKSAINKGVTAAINKSIEMSSKDKK